MKERKFTFQATFSLLSLRWILNSLIKSFGNDDSGGKLFVPRQDYSNPLNMPHAGIKLPGIEFF